MALENPFKSNAVLALAIGVAAAMLIPIVLPAVARAAKPLAKAAVKSGLILYEKGREAVAEMGEVMEDVVAEAKAEIEQEHTVAAATTTTATTSDATPPAPKA